MVVLRAALSALHVLALALGFAGVTLRGLRLRELRKDRGNAGARAALLRADNVWGLAALLWIVTGMARAFAGLEKTPDFYLRNGFFWVKMALFLAVFILAFIKCNDAEAVLVLVIPFAAALMARGAWLF